MKKRILCFGDSLTWGYNPQNHSRFDDDTRWTGVLQSLLGNDYLVIEEGQNGRTIALDDVTTGEKNGSCYIIPCIESQSPLDMIIIMLGTNDLKAHFHMKPGDVAGEMELLLKRIISHNSFGGNKDCRIILMSPPHLGDNLDESWLAEYYDCGSAIEYSKELSKWYRRLAKVYNCQFLDTADFVQASKIDACHMNGENHIKLGTKVAEIVKSIFE